MINILVHPFLPTYSNNLDFGKHKKNFGWRELEEKRGASGVSHSISWASGSLGKRQTLWVSGIHIAVLGSNWLSVVQRWQRGHSMDWCCYTQTRKHIELSLLAWTLASHDWQGGGKSSFIAIVWMRKCQGTISKYHMAEDKMISRSLWDRSLRTLHQVHGTWLHPR